MSDTALVRCSYLVLLGKAEAVIGLESLYVVSQVSDGNGGVLPHSWERGRIGVGWGGGEQNETWLFLRQTRTLTCTNTGRTTG